MTALAAIPHYGPDSLAAMYAAGSAVDPRHEQDEWETAEQADFREWADAVAHDEPPLATP